MRTILVLGVMLFLAGQLSAFDFAVDVLGPHNVFRGQVAHLAVKARVIEGGSTSPYVTSTLRLDIPDAKVQYWINITKSDNTPNKLVPLGNGFGIRIDTQESTPVGQYPFQLTLTGTGDDGMQSVHTVTIDFGVVDPPAPLVPGTFPPDTELPAIARWEQNMVTKADYHIARDHIGCCGDFGGVWFYDGARAFLQIADYTGDEKYADFAYRIFDIYAPYIKQTGGQGIARYPLGFQMVKHRDTSTDAQKTLAQEAIAKLAEQPSPAWRPYWNVDALQSSREPSLGFSSHVIGQEEGIPPHVLLRDHLGVMLGFYDQWFVSHNVLYDYPFMVGLWAEAMIDYYEFTHDPIVPPLLKVAADYIWANEWDPNSESWWLIGGFTPDTVFRQPAPDLNMMFVPLYGFVFQHTGDVRYRDIGDLAFTSGTQRAYLDGGKQFTQNYRWSFKYVEWRKSPVAPPPPPDVLQRVRDLLQRAIDLIDGATQKGAAPFSFTLEPAAVDEKVITAKQ